MSKSDAFDQNSQPVKVARVRVSFSPPLWGQGPRHPGDYVGPVSDTIGGQGTGVQIPTAGGDVFWPCGSLAQCRANASATCDSIATCRSFSCCKTSACPGKFQLHTSGLGKAIGGKSDWDFYYQNVSGTGFSQTLRPGSAAVEVQPCASPAPSTPATRTPPEAAPPAGDDRA